MDRRFRLISLAIGAAIALGVVRGTNDDEQIQTIKLPDLNVVVDRLQDFPVFTRKELVPPDFSPKSAPLYAQYPGHAFYEGVSAGTATVGVMLDRSGNPTDFLLIRYTKAYFGESLMWTARRQTFVPRTVRGVAVPGRFDFSYAFRPPTMVVTMSSFDAITQRGEQVQGGPSYAYAPHGEKEIDGGQLEPVQLAIPPLPADYVPSDPTAPRLLLTFFVDEKGHVRLPNVESAPSPTLVPDAIDAVQHWEFKPPKIKGKGILVFTARVLTFRATSLTPAKPRG